MRHDPHQTPCLAMLFHPADARPEHGTFGTQFVQWLALGLRQDLRTSVVDGILEVGVFESRRPSDGRVECDAVGYERTLQVRPARRFSGTAWRDLFGYLHFLGAPPGLVTLALPDGWALVAERDVEGSRTGRWRRTYAPSRNSPREQTVVLYQSFGARPTSREGPSRPPSP